MKRVYYITSYYFEKGIRVLFCLSMVGLNKGGKEVLYVQKAAAFAINRSWKVLSALFLSLRAVKIHLEMQNPLIYLFDHAIVDFPPLHIIMW